MEHWQMEHKKAGAMRCLIPPVYMWGHLSCSHKMYSVRKLTPVLLTCLLLIPSNTLVEVSFLQVFQLFWDI